MTLFKNFNIIKSGQILKNASLLVENDKIKHIGYNIPDTDDVIDGNAELYLSAGFIDIHVHGGGGYDFMDADADEYTAIAKHHASYGTTALYPTTIAASREELIASLAAFSKAKSVTGGAKLLGIHLEGPYLAMSQKGAMDPKYIRNPIPEEYEELLTLSNDIKRMTIAPELDGAVELGGYLYNRGVIPSIGHTDAICEDIYRAYRDGNYRLMTHLYSAMSLTRRIGINRFAGVVEAAYLIDDMYVEAIADGVHLPKDLLRLIYKIKGADRIALITDAMRASGMTEGIYILGSRKNGMESVVEDGVAKLLDKTAFAGSVATTDRLARTMTKIAEVPLVDTIKMLTETPAKVMNIFSERGSLDIGKFADIVAFDDDINVKLTMVEGTVIGG
jgi:N-acetylglucosamine-6-phosphate deacetylase